MSAGDVPARENHDHQGGANRQRWNDPAAAPDHRAANGQHQKEGSDEFSDVSVHKQSQRQGCWSIQLFRYPAPYFNLFVPLLKMTSNPLKFSRISTRLIITMFASCSENEIRGNARPHPDPLSSGARSSSSARWRCIPAAQSWSSALRGETCRPRPGIFTPLGVAPPQGNLHEFIIAGPVNSPAPRRKSGQGWSAALLGLFLLVPSRLAIAGAPAAGVSTSASKLAYNREIRPILSENCFACHGPDKNQRKGKLRLDVREAAIEKKALVPGKPEESELVKRLYTTNADDLMPPPESHKKLTPQQKELLERWIAQ